jgi:hypothetical protein
VNKRGFSFVWVAALVAVAAAPLRAHDTTPEILTYLRAEGATLQVLMRIPMAFLVEARLPVRPDRYLDLAGMDAAVVAVAADVARNLDVMDDGRPLASPRSTWTISRTTDASFASYEMALAHLRAPRAAAAASFDPDAAFVDLSLEYQGLSPQGRLSLRVNGLRTTNRPSQTRTVYVTSGGRSRIFVTSGTPRRIALEPRWPAVAAMFASLGIERLTQDVLHLLFVLCLVVPLRPARSTLGTFGRFAAAFAAAIAVPALWEPAGFADTSADSRLLLYRSLAGGALVVAALQNITPPRGGWVEAAAIAFGVFDGLVFGTAYTENLSYAGSHPIVSLAGFVAPILAASLWLFVVARPLVAGVYRVLPRRTGSAAGAFLQDRWGLVLLSVIPLHAGLHAVFRV